MSDVERTTLQSHLDKLSDRLRKRAEEFRRLGEFSDVHQALLTEIQERNDALRKRVKEAEAEGSAWELVKAELARDLSSLYDDLLQLEDRLDSETIKSTRARSDQKPKR